MLLRSGGGSCLLLSWISAGGFYKAADADRKVNFGGFLSGLLLSSRLCSLAIQSFGCPCSNVQMLRLEVLQLGVWIGP